MADNRTILYEGTHTNKKGEKHGFSVRVNPRLAALFLSLTIVTSTSACTIVNVNAKNAPKKNIETIDENEDINTIEDIIHNHPNMLSNKENIEHTVQYGESLSVIAEKYGTTVSRIEEQNKDILNDNGILQVGTVLKIEKNVKLSDLDQNINMLESYIFDYVIGSSHIAKMINKKDGPKNELDYYEKAIYGGDKNSQELDKQSIYGHAIRAYATFHDEEVEQTKDRKEIYLQALKGIAQEIQEKLNLSGSIQTVIPYSEYETYCKNKSTKYETSYTPYGNVIK